jgi:hypothetical protein
MDPVRIIIVPVALHSHVRSWLAETPESFRAAELEYKPVTRIAASVGGLETVAVDAFRHGIGQTWPNRTKPTRVYNKDIAVNTVTCVA